MGQYKVPQNVETEDKILGPLSVKQFIYVIIGLLWAFLMWRVFSFAIILAVVFALPVTGFFLLLGFGQREGVPFEDYLVAFIRYLVVPRKSIWVKDDSKEMIVKDVPKPQAVSLDKQGVTVGQLKQLASIIDTRGNFKDPSISLPDETGEAEIYAKRIIGPAQVGGLTASNEAGVVANQVATTKDDVLDEAGERATNVGQLLQSAEESNKAAVVAQMQQTLQQPSTAQPTKPPPTQNVTPTQTISTTTPRTAGLTVQRVAAHANTNSGQLSPGNSVDLRAVGS